MNLRHIFILPALLAAMACSDDSPVTPDTPDTPEGPDITNSVEKLVSIDAGQTFQTIAGFGASDCWSPAFVGKSWTSHRAGITELLFSSEIVGGKPKGIGLSQWRVNLGGGSAAQGEASGIEDKSRRAESYLTDDLTYDWTRCEGQRYFMDRAKELMRDADFPYLSCNWVDLRTGLRVLPSVKVFVRGGRRIAFVGVTTPETFTKSTPAYFMDKAQRKYIYDIQGGEDGKKLYDAVQKAIDKAKLLADVVIGLGHLGVDPSSSPWTSEEVIAHTSGFDAFIDGHSHTVMENKQVQDASGKAVTLTQTGSYFANVGEMTIAADGTITTKLISTHEGMDATIAAMQTGWVNTVDDMLGEEIAVGDGEFYISDAETGKRRIRSAETNLGDFVADGIYTYFNEVEQLHCDIAIMNGGGIRSDEDAGYWTFKTCKQVSPFGNVACLMSVTGRQIQDALEFGARFAGAEGKENGGFLQVAGARYTIHPMIPNTVQTNDKNVWTGSATTPRVSNVEIYDKTTGTYKPLDPNATYALAGMNYTLRNLGDGFAMFDGATLIKDYVSEDYLVMSSYAAMFGGVDANGLPHLASANSPLASYPGYLLNYENPYGAGRIQVV